MRNVRLIRNVQLGVKSLLLHKLRSALTTLGVVFGVGSVVAMLSVGAGAEQEALRQIEKLGSNNIILNASKPTAQEQRQSRTSGRSLTISYGLLYDDWQRLRELPTVETAAAAKIVRDNARLGDRAMEVRIVGTTPEWFDVVDRRVIAGRTLIESDMRQKAGVVVLAEHAARELLAGRHALGEIVRIGGEAYEVVGIVGTEGAAETGTGIQTPDRPVDAYIPLTTARQRLGDIDVQRASGSFSREEVELHQIIVRVGVPPAGRAAARSTAAGGLLSWVPGVGRAAPSATEHVEPTAEAIRAMLQRFHHQKDYNVSVPLALIRQARQTQRMFSIVLGSIAGISLLVGGIGIMNIMLASVTERTREIGVRRAIGAKQRQIIGQFLVETVVLSVVGGLVGVGLGILIPQGIERFADMPTVVTPWSIFLSLGISAGVGVIFGLYPAYRAATLDPIVALRHE